MPPLPLLNLPIIVQKAIICRMDLNNVVSLSLLSKKSKSILEILKFKVDEFAFIFRNNHCGLFVDNLTWCVDTSPDTIPNCNIDGFPVHISIDKKGECSRYVALQKTSENSDESRLDLSDKITKHLLSFLKVGKFRLDIIFESNFDLINLFIWKYTRNFHNIFIRQFTKFVELFPEEVEFLLEDLTINDLFLDFFCDSNFKYPRRSSKIQKITIGKQNLKYFDDFLSLDCRQMIYEISNIEFSEINKTLKQWMSGRNKKLEYLEIEYQTLLFIDPDKIFDGTNATPTIFTEEQLKSSFLALGNQGRNPWHDEGFEDEPILMDIKRTHDGCQATVILWDEIVAMLVWNNSRESVEFE